MTCAWLHVEGDGLSRDDFSRALGKAGVDVRPLGNGAAGPGIVIFTEPSEEVRTLIRGKAREGSQPIFAVGTSSSLTETEAWRLLSAGACDAFPWDRSNGPAMIASRLDRWNEVTELLRSPVVADQLVGRSPAWIQGLRKIVEVASFTDAPILITGETGTGKELVARLVHRLDRRSRKRELVLVDCTTITPSLSGSEFFGHERGAFTGAISARDGAFALADGGTLFLDEVSELPAALQAELLRVIQEGTYKRVGGNSWRQTRFRLICATNRDLAEQAERHEFRWDLYYRIAGWTCVLPPLRDRAEDIMPLARHFLAQPMSPREPVPKFEPAVENCLVRRDYPGNVRDLRQLIARIRFRHVGPGPITIGDVPDEERPVTSEDGRDHNNEALESAIRRALAEGATLKDLTSTVADLAVRVAIAEENGSVRRAASRLGVTTRALQLRRAANRRSDGQTGAPAA